MELVLYALGAIGTLLVILLLVFVLRGYFEANKIVKKKSIGEYYREIQNSANYCSIQEISANVKMIVVYLEDKEFFEHHGYNVRRIFQAAYTNIKRRKKKWEEAPSHSNWQKICIFHLKKLLNGK